jgi:hypothetical protein
LDLSTSDSSWEDSAAVPGAEVGRRFTEELRIGDCSLFEVAADIVEALFKSMSVCGAPCPFVTEIGSLLTAGLAFIWPEVPF